MFKPQPKNKAIRLKGTAKKKLQIKVLERDNFLCKICGAYTEAPPHHIDFVSQGGSDTEGNMITACVDCHRAIHDELINVYGTADRFGITYSINYERR